MRTGYLFRNGERVVLSHTSRLLADFMRKMRQLENDFVVRLGARPFSAEEPGHLAGDVPCTTA
ncbi:hypothetical protein AB0K43_24930 [Kitasatospora sp. NPDC049258]|uniref:hypothetical protein n=1 Tax=Kitasatospora sp. NPDC049258 TaxID=3155394 RepID=UPI00342BE4A3